MSPLPRPYVRRLLVGGLTVGLLAACGASPDELSSPGLPSVTQPTASSPTSSAASADPVPSPSAGSPSASPSGSASASPAAPVAAELPRGGRTLFPRYRLVGYAGLTGSEALGRLGIGDLDERARELQRRARPYADSREVLPVLEVIATIVQPRPGRDGQFRTRMDDDQVERYLRAARKADALLLLNIQPGQSDFLTETKAYERFLREPDVGVALDPEWAMSPGQIPGRQYGRTTGRELDEVAEYLSGLVAEHNLPEKVMVYHQVAPSVVRKESGLTEHPGVAVVKSVDGIGSPGAKEATYNRVKRSTPDFVHAGFKLFYVEDREHGPLMTPKEVLALRPQPEYVMYE